MIKLEPTRKLLSMTKNRLAAKLEEIHRRTSVHIVNLESEVKLAEENMQEHSKQLLQIETDLNVIKSLMMLDNRNFKGCNEEVAEQLANIITGNIQWEIDTCLDFISECKDD